jgi:hypothetical protein
MRPKPEEGECNNVLPGEGYCRAQGAVMTMAMKITGRISDEVTQHGN